MDDRVGNLLPNCVTQGFKLVTPAIFQKSKKFNYVAGSKLNSLGMVHAYSMFVQESFWETDIVKIEK